jgi:hypothetical protein
VTTEEEPGLVREAPNAQAVDLARDVQKWQSLYSEAPPNLPARTMDVSIPHDAEIIRGWAEEVQARGMRSDHIYELADAVLTLLDQRDRLDEIRQRDDRAIKHLKVYNEQLLARVAQQHVDYQKRLARSARMLEKRSEERDQLARKVEAARALADNPHFLFSTRELHAALDSTDR